VRESQREKEISLKWVTMVSTLSASIKTNGGNTDPVHVLFADDDAETQQLVGMILKNENMQVVYAHDGSQVFDVWQMNPVNLMILDIMMPIMDGLETCRRVRRVSDIPIILLTAKTQESDVLEGFNTGADDYITKPFRAKELVARINAVLHRTRRQRVQAGRQLAYDELVMDMDTRRVTLDGKYLRLTPLEFQLLHYFMQHPGDLLTKEELLENVWGYLKPGGNMNLVETTIRRLRMKIEVDASNPRYIQTVWGRGYRLGS
jgi:two-component system response regulator MtrA